jgi:hypothetical protein
MSYPDEQVQELKSYCSGLRQLIEGGVTYFLLEALRLPVGCTPASCDALLCPTARDGYPSRLFLAEKVTSAYTRNWNVSNARIGERNWVAFSWKVALTDPTLAQVLVEHLKGFTRAR